MECKIEGYGFRFKFKGSSPVTGELLTNLYEAPLSFATSVNRVGVVMQLGYDPMQNPKPVIKLRFN